MIARPTLASLVLAAALAPSCKTPEVTFELNVPDSIAQNVAWFEVGVFPAGACPPPSELAGGVPEDGAVARLAFQSSVAAPPALGNLVKSRYAFAAAARQQDCSVIATGCADVDVASSRDVSISLAPTGSPAGACESGSVCNDARCVPGSDNGDPSVGAGCSLALVGAGPLGDPLSSSTTLLTAPVVAATSSGFLVAYREYDPSTPTVRLTLIPIDSGGGSGVPLTTTLTACASVADPDATGLAFDATGSVGLVALARLPCKGGGPGNVGVDLFAVDPTGAVSTSGFKALPATTISLGTAHALTVTPAGFFLAMTLGTQTYAATIAGVDLAESPVAFGGTASQSESAGWTTATLQGTALLALGTGPLIAPSLEGGAGDGGSLDAGSPEAGAGTTLRLNTIAGANLLMLPTPTEFPGQWASLSMVGTRVLVASDGASPGKPVAWTAFDVGKSMPVATDGFGTSALGKIVYSDVALHQDHAFFAAEIVGLSSTISVVLLDHVSTMPVYTTEVPFADDPRIPIGNLRDGLVSVAASDSRVAVVWGTGKTLGPNDNVGGYAVFACTP